MFARLLALFAKRPPPPPAARSLTRCATPHLWAGGIVVAHTGNLAEIIRGEASPGEPRDPVQRDARV